MPNRDNTFIGDLIYYQYAKIMAKSTFGAPDGREAKRKHYGFVKRGFRELGGGKSLSTYSRTPPSPLPLGLRKGQKVAEVQEQFGSKARIRGYSGRLLTLNST